MNNKNVSIFGLDVEALADVLAPLLAAKLVDALPAVASALARDDGQAMSASGAAKMAKFRRAHVAAAMRSGALRAWRNERRWVTTVGDTANWIRAGRPTAHPS
jgi:hypothetical protein